MVLKKKPRIPSGLELLKSLPNARREWNSRTRLERFYYFFGVGKAPSDIIQLPLFREDVMNVPWFAYFFLVYSSILSVLVFYTFYVYIINGEFPKALPCTNMFAIGLIAVRKTFNI